MLRTPDGLGLGSAAQIFKGVSQTAAAYLHAVVGPDLDQVLDELRRVLKVDVGCREKQEIDSLRRRRLRHDTCWS